MSTHTSVSRLTPVLAMAVCLLSVASALASAQQPAGEAAKAPAQAAPERASPAAAARERAPDAAALAERLEALEKQDLVLREDLGRSLLDARTRLDAAAKQQAEAMARMQQKIAELEAQLAAERERESRRSRNLWLAFGVLALAAMAR